MPAPLYQKIKQAICGQQIACKKWSKGQKGRRLRVGFGLWQTNHALADLELAALFEQFHALEALEDVTFGGNGAGTFEAAML
jgi:hypothetical protein